MWNGSGNIAIFIQLTINFTLLVFFIVGTCKNSLRHSPLTTLIMVVSYIATSIVIIMLFITRDSPLRKFWILLLIIWIVFSIVMAVLVLRSSVLQISFLVLAIINIQCSIMKFAEIIYTFELTKQLIPTSGVRLIVTNLIAIAIIGPIVWYLFFNLLNKAISFNINKSYWKYLIFIPASAYLFGLFDDYNRRNYMGDNLFISFVTLVLINVLTYFSYTAILQMIIKTNQSLIATQKAINIEQLLHIKNEQYKSLTESIIQTDRLHHDMRHHFITLKGYSENKDFDSLNEYLVKCMGETPDKETTPLCENQSIDMILRHYIAIAKEYDVQVDVSVNFGLGIKMSDVDLSVLFGNLIENAVDACKNQTKGRRFITIKVKTFHSEMLAISISNSFSGKIIRNGESFISTKHAGMGIGTSSVRNIVEQHGGNCRFNIENNIFKVSILLTP